MNNPLDNPQDQVTPIVVLKATTFRFPRGQRYVVRILSGAQYRTNGRNGEWRLATPEGDNGFRLDRGMWYVKIEKVPFNLETKRREVALGQVNSIPPYWFWPALYGDADPWPPPIDVNGSNDYTSDS